MAMDARKQRILEAIVALYANDGEPVGSGLLANYFDMAVSSATLRNEMAALTKLGLLEQPHTSAGRVPSAKGYRYYLDNLLTDDQPLDRVTHARVEAVFASLDHEPEKLAQGAAKALAAISGCTAAVSTPCAEDLCIAHYEVVQVGRSAAAVVKIGQGVVQHDGHLLLRRQHQLTDGQAHRQIQLVQRAGGEQGGIPEHRVSHRLCREAEAPVQHHTGIAVVGQSGKDLRCPAAQSGREAVLQGGVGPLQCLHSQPELTEIINRGN